LILSLSSLSLSSIFVGIFFRMNSDCCHFIRPSSRLFSASLFLLPFSFWILYYIGRSGDFTLAAKLTANSFLSSSISAAIVRQFEKKKGGPGGRARREGGGGGGGGNWLQHDFLFLCAKCSAACQQSAASFQSIRPYFNIRD